MVNSFNRMPWSKNGSALLSKIWTCKNVIKLIFKVLAILEAKAYFNQCFRRFRKQKEVQQKWQDRFSVVKSTHSKYNIFHIAAEARTAKSEEKVIKIIALSCFCSILRIGRAIYIRHLRRQKLKPYIRFYFIIIIIIIIFLQREYHFDQRRTTQKTHILTF